MWLQAILNKEDTDANSVHYTVDTGKTDAQKGQARTNIGAQAATDSTLETTDKTVSGAINELKDSKQDELTAGTNISIENGVISAVGGGGAVNVVQVTGTSTTDVMSQKASTDTFALKQDLVYKANVDGFYHTLGAGVAENLVGKGTVSAHYTRRTSGGTADIGNGAAQIKSIHGNTIVWNQLADQTSSSATQTNKGITFTNNNDGSFTISGTATANGSFAFSNKQGQLISGHKYYVFCPLSVGVSRLYSDNPATTVISSSSGLDNIVTSNVTSVGNCLLYFTFSSGDTFNHTVTPQLFDLTQMFGAGNEPSTVEEFRALFPLQYYAYNAGELLSFNGTGIETNGFNQWDEDMELGTLNGQTELPSTTNIRTKNYVPVIVGQTYYFYCGKGNNVVTIQYYDFSKTYIVGSYRQFLANGSSFTIPSGVGYVRWYMDSAYGTTYNHDICINLSHSGVRNREYEAYWDSTLALPISTYFANGMRSAGTAYDELTPSKAVTRIGAVDLGTLNWTYNSSSVTPNFSTSNLQNIIKPTSGYYVKGNVLTNKYTTGVWGNVLNTQNAYGYLMQGGYFIAITDSNYTDAAAFKAAMSGVYLFYELATPTEQAISPALNLNYRVDDFGTENLLPVNDDEPTTSPIKCDVQYAMNAVDTLRNLDVNYQNQASMDALLTVLGTACNGTFAKTWDSTNRKYTYTFTPNTEGE